MDIRDQLLDLEMAARRISDGLEVIQVMVLGLDEAGSQYAGALNAVWSYLSQANQELQTQLNACMRAV